MNKSYREYKGRVYNSADRLVDDPAILIDGDVVVKIDKYDIVNLYFSVLSSSECFADIILIRFDDRKLEADSIAYIFRRCTEFTASGFARKLTETWGTSEFIEWLENEKRLVPLEVE